MTAPRISVVTPTWQRHGLLLDRCIPAVQVQTWPDVEHVIVSDGPDPVLRDKLAGLPLVYDELGDHDPGARWGERARIRGDAIASGDLLAHVDDDDEITPTHLEQLAAALAEHDADFAYSQMRICQPNGASVVVGQDPPCYGHIGISFLYRRELLELGTWCSDERTIDWNLIERWMARGARWAYVPDVTVTCYPSVFWGTR